MQASPNHTTRARLRARRAWIAALAAVSVVAISVSVALAASSGVTKAQQELAPYLKVPTKIGNFPPLKAKPPKKTVVYLGTSEVSNVQVAKAVQQVAKIAGWNYSLVSYDAANPATFTAAMNTAVAKHANYVMEAGTPLTPAILNQAKANHIKFALDAVYPVKVAGQVIDSSDGYTQDFLMGKLVGDEFVIDSKGAGKAVVEHIPQFPILDAFTNGFQAAVKANCPGCKSVLANVTIPQLTSGQLNSVVVSAVKRNPGYNYLVSDDGPFFETIVPALKQSGLNNIKVMGEAGDASNFQGIRTGDQLAWTGYSVAFPAYEMMDAAFRDAEGMKVPPADATQPTQMVTKANVAKISNNWNYPPNALQQLEKLWHLK
jgi:ribose transport system substrate-binding protein